MSDVPEAALDAAALAQVRRMYRFNEAETDPRCLREAHAITDPIVEAAAPLIAAQAWDDGYAKGQSAYAASLSAGQPIRYTNPYREGATRA